MKTFATAFSALLISASGGCESPPPPPECTAHSDCSDEAKPYCTPDEGDCEALPLGYQLGWGDGSAESVEFELVYQAPVGKSVRGLDFRPGTEELWVTEAAKIEDVRTCNLDLVTRENCIVLGADITIVYRATGRADRVETLRDGNAVHFMRLPTALVFGDADTFATCPEARTCNADSAPENFAGPTLWSARRTVFGVDVGKNGSHLDMLHGSPFCMGMAHEVDNVYWVYNGHDRAIDRYDFSSDHGPGEEDHSDGKMERYIAGELLRVSGVSSQMVYDENSGFLYISDSGNERILRLDTQSGRRGGPVGVNRDRIDVHNSVDDAEFEELELSGDRLGVPSGLILHDDILFIADYSNAEFRAVTADGKLLRRLFTRLDADTIGSMVMGPDDRIYFTIPKEGKVLRILHDPR
jgi:hypothetical protein